MKESLNEYFKIFENQKGKLSKMPECVKPAIDSLVEKGTIAGQHLLEGDTEYFLIKHEERKTA